MITNWSVCYCIPIEKPGVCATYFINEGITVYYGVVDFTSLGPVDSHICSLDDKPFYPCEFVWLIIIISMPYFRM